MLLFYHLMDTKLFAGSNITSTFRTKWRPIRFQTYFVPQFVYAYITLSNFFRFLFLCDYFFQMSSSICKIDCTLSLVCWNTVDISDIWFVFYLITFRNEDLYKFALFLRINNSLKVSAHVCYVRSFLTIYDTAFKILSRLCRKGFPRIHLAVSSSWRYLKIP